MPALLIPYSADVADDGSRCLIRVSGEIDFESGPRLRECIASAAGKRVPVDVDLSGVRFMDSFGHSCLIRASRDARMLGSTLTVVRTSPAVEQLFRNAGTAELFGISTMRSERDASPAGAGAGQFPERAPEGQT